MLRLHRSMRMSSDLISTPGVVKRAHTAGMNFDGDGSDPAAMTILREQQKILAGYAKDRADNMRALKEARAEAWEAKAATRLVEEENAGISVALKAAEERCEATRVELALKLGAIGTVAGAGSISSTDVAVALYDAAVASGELAPASDDGDSGGSGGGRGALLLERARARADGIIADAEALAARLVAEAEDARGGWNARVKDAASVMYRAAAGEIARAKDDAVAEAARETAHAKAQVERMNRVIEERVETLTSQMKADVEKLRAQLARRREDNEAIGRERDALLAEANALRDQGEAARGEHEAALVIVEVGLAAVASCATTPSCVS